MDRTHRGMYDSALLGMLSNEGQIYPFLDAIFDFLYRRTDFYHIRNSTSDKIGFPPGVARRLVKIAFQKYNNIANGKGENSEEKVSVVPQTEEELAVPLSTEVVEVETTASDDTLESADNDYYDQMPSDGEPSQAKSAAKNEAQDNGTDDAKADGSEADNPTVNDNPKFDP